MNNSKTGLLMITVIGEMCNKGKTVNFLIEYCHGLILSGLKLDWIGNWVANSLVLAIEIR